MHKGKHNVIHSVLHPELLCKADGAQGTSLLDENQALLKAQIAP